MAIRHTAPSLVRHGGSHVLHCGDSRNRRNLGPQGKQLPTGVSQDFLSVGFPLRDDMTDQNEKEGTMDNEKLNNMNSLSDDALDAVSGGYILDRGTDIEDSFRYVVIDPKTGDSVSYNNDLASAQQMANGAFNDPWRNFPKYGDEIITPDQYKEIFGKSW